jgi:exonuclease III
MSIYNIESWNIWVLNGSSKHKTVNDWINNYNLSIIGILETKIVSNHMGRLRQL